MEFRFIHHFWICLALAALFLLALGCESPVSGDRPENANDPKSEIYEVREISGIQISPEPDGSVIIKWQQSSSAVDLYLIEKSLGNDSSYVEIGRVPKTENQFSDNTGEIRGETHYRVTSLYTDGSEETIIDQNSNRLEFGTLKNFTYEILEDENKLRINWETEHPLITHYEVYRNNKSIRFESGQLKASFIDPFANFDFHNRHYAIIAFIEGDGFRDLISENDFMFSVRDSYMPSEFEVRFLNEQDWELTWKDPSFFLGGYILTRTVGDIVEEFEIPATERVFIDSTLAYTEPLEADKNRGRRYKLEGFVGNQRGNPIFLNTGLFLPSPILTFDEEQNADPNQINMKWSFSDDQHYDMVKGYIVERANELNFEPGEFMEIAKIPPEQTSFADANVSTKETYYYRVRTKTSRIDYGLGTAFGNGYELGDELVTPGTEQISALEIDSDGTNLAVLEGLSIYTTGIDIYDISSKQYTHTIRTLSEDVISSFKISPDGSAIYFSLPYVSRILKADFPSGNNQEVLIENASYEEGSNENSGIRSIDISPDGLFLVGLGGRGYVIKYDLTTGQRVLEYKNYDTGTVYWGPNPAFSSDGELIAGSSGGLYVINSETAELLYDFSFITPNFVHTGFSINSRYLYTSRYRSNSSIFDLDAGYSIEKLPGPATPHPNIETMFLAGSLIVSLDENRITGSLHNFANISDYRNIFSSRFLSENEIIIGLENSIEIWQKSDEERWNMIRKLYVGK